MELLRGRSWCECDLILLDTAGTGYVLLASGLSATKDDLDNWIRESLCDFLFAALLSLLSLLLLLLLLLSTLILLDGTKVLLAGDVCLRKVFGICKFDTVADDVRGLLETAAVFCETI